MASSSSTSNINTVSSKPTIVEWLVDTRPLWPEAHKTKDLEQYAGRALSLLPAEAAAGVLKYYHLKDAKLSLLSHLLKRYAISSLIGIPWSKAEPRRDGSGGKPGFPGIAFNVSHQAGIVACVAVVGYRVADRCVSKDNDGDELEVGIDVVSTLERRDRDRGMISQSKSRSSSLEGFKKFVIMHSEVFGRGESEILTGSNVTELLERKTGLDETDRRLRAFYTLWCLREAYVKMTGEALLASWLGDLEFRGWMAPVPVGERDFELPSSPVAATRENEDSVDVFDKRKKDGEVGVLRNPEIWLHGSRVQDTNIVLRSLGTGIMVSTAARSSGRKQDALGWELGKYRILELETILKHAEDSP